MALANIAPEVFIHILSFLPLQELYRIRSVSRTWQIICEELIYRCIRSRGHGVAVKIGMTHRVTIQLVAHAYDPINRVIEFRAASADASVMTLHDRPVSSWIVQKNRMQIHFKPWKEVAMHKRWPGQAPRDLSGLTADERAQVLFHLKYNPALEREYELPPPTTGRHWRENDERRYVGDKGMIMAFSYVHANEPDLWHTLEQNQDVPPPGTGYLPASYYAYPNAITAMTPASPAPRVKVHWLRVTLAWIISGLDTRVKPVSIYPERYACLSQALARHGIFKYNPLSEPVLCYIAQQEPLASDPMAHFPTARAILHPSHSDMQPSVQDTCIPWSLLDYAQTHTHECHTRLSRLQHLLEGAGVDARVLWKYTFAKSYVSGNGSLLGEEDVVRRIQDSEEEWRLQRHRLFRRLCALDDTRIIDICI